MVRRRRCRNEKINVNKFIRSFARRMRTARRIGKFWFWPRITKRLWVRIESSRRVRFWIKLARQRGFGLQFSARLPIKFRQFRKQFATERQPEQHQSVPGFAR